MIITIIGSGNTATVLGRLLKSNHHIHEIAGRNKTAVNDLAEKLNAGACVNISEINKNSDVYIIAVNDNAVADVSAHINLNEKIVVHTCGSIAMNVLEQTSKNYGVFYPLQSLRKELNHSPDIPFLVDGNNTYSSKNVYNLASSISNFVTNANDEIRLRYHLSAIIVSNFSNHLFVLAKEYCDANNADFDLLLPLIEETAHRLHSHHPSGMQTGPAIRGDHITIQKHLQLLDEFPQLKKTYEIMTESIQHFHKQLF